MFLLISLTRKRMYAIIWLNNVESYYFLHGRSSSAHFRTGELIVEKYVFSPRKLDNKIRNIFSELSTTRHCVCYLSEGL
jgi:hypothetical protein